MKRFIVLLCLFFATSCGSSAQEICDFTFSSITNGANFDQRKSFWTCNETTGGSFDFAIFDDNTGVFIVNGFVDEFFTWAETNCATASITSSQGTSTASNSKITGNVLTFDYSQQGGKTSVSCGLVILQKPVPIEIPPNMGGDYTRANTSCPDDFDDTLSVTQMANFVGQPGDPDLIDFVPGDFGQPSGNGEIDANGDWSISSFGIVCGGNFQEGDNSISMDCTLEGIGNCTATYEKI